MKSSTDMAVSPEEIFAELQSGRVFKEGIGNLGLYEQNRRNERFYVGDQWHGARCGGERPLVRHNVIKRIGEYKMAVIGANPVAVNYHAEGVPCTVAARDRIKAVREQLASDPMSGGDVLSALSREEAIHAVMSAMTDYFTTTAERIRFEQLKVQMLREAYVRGSAFLHVYWDPTIDTGLFADDARTVPVRGDVAAEVLDVENVYFGDPNTADIQSQPYVLIVQRKTPAQIEAMRDTHSRLDGEIRPDDDYGASAEAQHARKATLVTKLWKEYDRETGQCHVKAVQVCRGVTVRKPWDLGIRLYPLAGFTWEARKDCAYGDSEITYLIPNQIAINRMITASVWAVMMMGIPITVVNGDVVQGPVTNDPGQVLRVFGTAEDVQNCVRYVNPPQFSPKFDDNINSLIHNTLSQSGANDAALGDVRPDNTSAIIAVREAATLPLQNVQNRFYGFVEDFARVLAEFWVMYYGERRLKVVDENGVWYMPFRAEDYRPFIISAKIDVGAGSLWGEAQSVHTLDNLLKAQIITPKQYLERLPKGFVPDIDGLIEELTPAASAEESAQEDPIEAALPEEYRQQWAALPPEERDAWLQEALNPSTVMG